MTGKVGYNRWSALIHGIVVPSQPHPACQSCRAGCAAAIGSQAEGGGETGDRWLRRPGYTPLSRSSQMQAANPWPLPFVCCCYSSRRHYSDSCDQRRPKQPERESHARSAEAAGRL